MRPTGRVTMPVLAVVTAVLAVPLGATVSPGSPDAYSPLEMLRGMVGPVSVQAVPAPHAASPPQSAAPDTVLPEPQAIPELLASGQDRARALAGIGARAEELSGRRATLWIQLLAVAEKGGPEAGALAARALLHADEGEPAEGAGLIRSELDTVPEADRPALLGLAAHLLDGPDPAEAAELRTRLLDLAPDASEAPEAALRLARYLAGPGEDRERAVELLEELIVSAPNHPVAPTARHMLTEIRRSP